MIGCEKRAAGGKARKKKRHARRKRRAQRARYWGRCVAARGEGPVRCSQSRNAAGYACGGRGAASGAARGAGRAASRAFGRPHYLRQNSSFWIVNEPRKAWNVARPRSDQEREKCQQACDGGLNLRFRQRRLVDCQPRNECGPVCQRRLHASHRSTLQSRRSTLQSRCGVGEPQPQAACP